METELQQLRRRVGYLEAEQYRQKVALRNVWGFLALAGCVAIVWTEVTNVVTHFTS